MYTVPDLYTFVLIVAKATLGVRGLVFSSAVPSFLRVRLVCATVLPGSRDRRDGTVPRQRSAGRCQRPAF